MHRLVMNLKGTNTLWPCHLHLLRMTFLLATLTKADEIDLSNLDNGPGILPFNLGSTRIVSHYHSFIQCVDLVKLRDSIHSVQEQINDINPILRNKTLLLFQMHIKYLVTKLEKVSQQLKTFEISRVKRGLINGLGSIIRTISGNLDYTDAIKYDNAIKILEENNNKIFNEFNNHISLTKKWLFQNNDIINNLTTNQRKLENLINNLTSANNNLETDIITFTHIIQTFLILGDNIETITDELYRLENWLAFIHAQSTHHSMLSINMHKDIMNKLSSLYKKEELLDISFRDYFDVIKVGYYYSNRNIVLIFKFPIVFPEYYLLYHLSAVPNMNNQILIPPKPFLAIHNKDFMYIEAECPKINGFYLCDNKFNNHYGKKPDCIERLITTQQIQSACQFVSLILTTEAVEQLDDKHYIITFPEPSSLKLSCNQQQFIKVQGSYLVTLPLGCSIESSEFTIINSNDHIRGKALKIIDLHRPEKIEVSQTSLKLNTIDLKKLQEISNEISLQPKISGISETNSLYHTTIPFYAIILSASALSIAIIIYRSLKNRNSLTVKEKPEPTKDEEGSHNHIEKILQHYSRSKDIK